MMDKPTRLLLRPAIYAVRSPPADFTGDPETGLAFYICSVKGCKNIWGLQWKLPNESDGVVKWSEYKALATKKPCLRCIKSNHHLESSASSPEALAATTNGGTKNIAQDDAENVTSDNNTEHIMDKSNAENVTSDNNTEHIMDKSNAQQGDLWEIVDHREAEESWQFV
ncbi:hypothetical protein A1O3_09011 [Capronia epimyces CBS 606.96]|uniref:Uncharacterized protein n=1 Tax=Capronia epimyces CBS 606.96 TaxID=1182542 RepID=W9XBM2_9EURO|nr:uncharacterized protein A1O3_09011 [Capronia epimyces CBS 606.96]EXJ77852.1 hypothetical protein A1O3_09011 [Capronia epimyces CBS 606.96]